MVTVRKGELRRRQGRGRDPEQGHGQLDASVHSQTVRRGGVHHGDVARHGQRCQGEDRGGGAGHAQEADGFAQEAAERPEPQGDGGGVEGQAEQQQQVGGAQGQQEGVRAMGGLTLLPPPACEDDDDEGLAHEASHQNQPV